MCRNGRYTERGIKAIDGFMSERWRIEPGYVMKVDDPRAPRRAARADDGRHQGLGAGSRGRPARLLGAAHRPRDRRGTDRPPGGADRQAARLDVHVLDRATSGPKPELVRSLGAAYHTAGSRTSVRADVIVECTGVGQVISDAIGGIGAGVWSASRVSGPVETAFGPAVADVAAAAGAQQQRRRRQRQRHKRHW